MQYQPINNNDLDRILRFLAQQNDFVFLETGKTDQTNTKSYLFTKPVDRIVLKAQEDPKIFFSKVKKYQRNGFYLAGWMAYELGYKLEPSLHHFSNPKSDEDLANLGIFQAPIVYDHNNGKFTPSLPPLSDQKRTETTPDFNITNLHPNQDRHDYLAAIKKIKSYIGAGDTYQVNYTLKLLFDFFGNPASLYKTLRRNQEVSYGAYLKSGNTVIQSFSPELFFRKTGNSCIVRPMKGTSARGRTMSEDLKKIETLHNDPKNRSENVMIVDLLRNDLGRLAKMGFIETLSLFDIETFQTLHQMTSTIKGELRPDLTITELLQALFPCGSVTGAPKIRTMEIINELEQEPRGVYTGGIGFITPTGDMVFNVPIRTIKLENGKGMMGIGSGIIHDSDPENEWEECLLKGRFLTNPTPEYQLIETLLWSATENYWLLDQHLERLSLSAEYFQFTLDIQTVKEKLAKLSKDWSSQSTETTNLASKSTNAPPRRVRIVLNKDGSLIITNTKCDLPNNTTLPVAPTPSKSVSKAILSTVKTKSSSPHLFHKTTLREIYNRERETALNEGFLEVIFMNEKNEITEGSISNIIIKKDNRYLTPPVTCGLLPGTFRNQLLKTHPNKISEKILYKKDLLQADNIYIANSVRGLVEISLGY